jgi:hypothetical protein
VTAVCVGAAVEARRQSLPRGHYGTVSR